MSHLLSIAMTFHLLLQISMQKKRRNKTFHSPAQYRITMSSITKNGTRQKTGLSFALAALLLAAPDQPGAANWNPLPDSGQGKWFDRSGNEMGRPAAKQTGDGQDAQYQGRPLAYRENKNQTVTDLNSGLMWMKSDDGTPRSWQDAVSYCDGLVFAGFSDWRLPTRFELDSIVHYGRSFPAAASVFSCRASFYWSSETYAGNQVYAWGIYGNDGADHWLDKINHYYTRCVRTGQ
jgi:hypothetical protein